MDEDTIKVALFCILPYLNSDDLHNISQVSRSCYHLAKYEKIVRDSTHCIVDKLKFNHRIRWIFKDRQNINFFNKTPCLQIYFTNDNNDINVPDGCPCRTKEFSSFTINLKSYFNIRHGEALNPVGPVTFLAKYFTELSTFSFINHSMEDEYSTKQQRFNYINDTMKIKTMFHKFLSYFHNPGRNSIVMIIFCQSCFFIEFLDLMYAVLRRVPIYKITIWGATVDAISICRCSLHEHNCRIDSKFLFILINRAELRTYVGYLDESCNSADKIERELTMLKRRTTLSSNSIALMHVSYSRLGGFYALDTSIFREVFPNVCLFSFYGDRSFSVSGLRQLLSYRNRLTMESMRKLTCIVILSHN